MQIGDCFIVGDGYDVVAIGVICGNSVELKKVHIEVGEYTKRHIFDPNDEEPRTCCDCRIVKLQFDDRFVLMIRGRLREVTDKDKIEQSGKLFDEYQLWFPPLHRLPLLLRRNVSSEGDGAGG